MMMELMVIAVMATVISAGVIYVTLSSFKRERVTLGLRSDRRDRASKR